jgi:hypothetical protein
MPWSYPRLLGHAGAVPGRAEAMFLALIKMCTCRQFWLVGYAGAGPRRAGAVPWHAGTMLDRAGAMLLTFTHFKRAWPWWGLHQGVLESCWTMLGLCF